MSGLQKDENTVNPEDRATTRLEKTETFIGRWAPPNTDPIVAVHYFRVELKRSYEECELLKDENVDLKLLIDKTNKDYQNRLDYLNKDYQNRLDYLNKDYQNRLDYLNKTIKDHELAYKELETKVKERQETMDNLLINSAVARARTIIENKEMQYLQGDMDLPNFFNVMINDWTRKENRHNKKKGGWKGSQTKKEGRKNEDSTQQSHTQEEGTENEGSFKNGKDGDQENATKASACATETSKRVLILLKHYYQKQSDWEKGRSLEKHYKLWLYIILYSLHPGAACLRSKLGEPAENSSEKELEVYMKKVIIFCGDISYIYKNTSECIHNTSNSLSKDKIIELLVKGGELDSDSAVNALRMLFSITE